MKFLAVTLAIFIFAIGNSAIARVTKHDKQYFLVPDDDGHVHLVNINAEPRFVDPIDTNNITFILYTQANLNEPIEFHPHEFDKFVESGLFDPNRPSLFNTHGWTGDGKSVHLGEVKDAFLERHDVNILNIDWGGPAHTFYTQAVQYVNPLGDMIGDFINEVIDYYDVDPSTIGLMGHSLGGQLIARIGYATNGRLGYIISLDPAYPMFEVEDPADRLDSSDAKFVQVCHANSGFLGVPHSVGHADFHLNGGVKQPDCGPDIIGTCSHFLIKDMIAESYWATYLSWKCDSYEEFLAGDCEENETSYWGGFPVDTTASGDYYLRTNGAPPFVIE